MGQLRASSEAPAAGAETFGQTSFDPGVLRVLEAVARGALGPGYEDGVPSRMAEILGRLPTSAERAQAPRVLRALDSRAGALALTGRAVPLSRLHPAEVEGLIVRLKNSRLPERRRLARSLISLALSALYGYSESEWRRIGYPGPMGPPPDEPRRLSPLEIDSDERLCCDAVVIGSGAGGGCVAAGLAAHGLDVVVLERGGYRAERDFTHREADATRDLYLYGMTLTTADGSVRIVSGSTLGGGTVVNYATAFHTPRFVLQEWARVSGVEAFVSGEFEDSLDQVARRLSVNADSSAPGKRDQLLEEGLKKLGWHVDRLPRAVRGCSQDAACGYCGFGCRIGAKQSTLRTYLEDAAAKGTRIACGADVRKVKIRDGRAAGVEAFVGPHRLSVHAKAVVCAAGAIETPALLLRSGLGGEVGKHLRLHPGSATFGVFDEEVRMWEGTLQSRYSAEFRQWDGGYGPIFETVPVHPGSGWTVIPWTSAEDHRARMEDYARLSFCAVLPRDRSEGRVRLARDGNPRVFYRLSQDDERRIIEGNVRAAQVMESAGAREIYSMHSQPARYSPSSAGTHERWAAEVRRLGARGGCVTFYSYHQMGSCRMGLDPRSSVVDSGNETHEVDNLFVADASCFPTASGVNPMLTAYAFAHRAASSVARRFT